MSHGSAQDSCCAAMVLYCAIRKTYSIRGEYRGRLITGMLYIVKKYFSSQGIYSMIASMEDMRAAGVLLDSDLKGEIRT